MKKLLKPIIAATLLVAIVAGSAVLYQNLSTGYQVSTLVTDQDDIFAQIGQQPILQNDAPSSQVDIPQTEKEILAPPSTEKSETTEALSPADDQTASNENGSTETNNVPQSDSTEGNSGSENKENTESTENSESSSSHPKYLAPDFTVTDENGNTVKLSDYRGKPVVINFWVTWCYYCKVEMPDFNEAYKKYPDIQFLMINAMDGENIETAKKFKANNSYDFEIFFDTDSEASNAYNVHSYPATFFISAEGELIVYARGMLSAANLEKCIAMILPSKKED